MNKAIDKALMKYKADSVVLYKFERGKKRDYVDFVEHRDVVVLAKPLGGIVVYDGKKLISYPEERIYEIVASGEAMTHVLKQSLVVIRDQEKQIDQMDEFFEPKPQ